MDVKVSWKVSSDPETLVSAIARCKDQLIALAKQKHCMTRVGLLTYEAFAAGKLLQMLELSLQWTAAHDDTLNDVEIRMGRDNPYLPDLVADFSEFKLYRLAVLGDEMIRVVIEVDVGDTASQIFFGTIEMNS
jgi:hypothetical protein